MRRLVVLPPLRAGSARCSVKPAWRGPYHSKRHATPSLRRDRVTQLAYLNRASQLCCT
ncbi:hypothetical protein QJS10_CPA10g00917 [Acorus calamus]|uniref:Uncharacterized protein n=1 Tax=Acorus calamus TaxID=4465 RepID=A0AAV9DYV5_ACOCL|nr:hypothetical protein QJS10_CPA10g00917 [Acorus calamus]